MLDHVYAYQLWVAVILNAALVIFFVFSFLKPRGKWEWRSMGVFSAFAVALFTEMYGFPLTIYLLTSVLGSQYPVLDPFTHKNGHLWVALTGGSPTTWMAIMLVSNGIILAALMIMGAAWKQIHRASGELVTSGLYGRVRHPQYASLFLLTLGFLLQWPTLITVLMFPVLMLMYYRLALREEKEMETRFGERYLSYRRQVPMFIPRLFSPSYKSQTMKF